MLTFYSVSNSHCIGIKAGTYCESVRLLDLVWFINSNQAFSLINLFTHNLLLKHLLIQRVILCDHGNKVLVVCIFTWFISLTCFAPENTTHSIKFFFGRFGSKHLLNINCFARDHRHFLLAQLLVDTFKVLLELLHKLSFGEDLRQLNFIIYTTVLLDSSVSFCLGNQARYGASLTLRFYRLFGHQANLTSFDIDNAVWLSRRSLGLLRCPSIRGSTSWSLTLLSCVYAFAGTDQSGVIDALIIDKGHVGRRHGLSSFKHCNLILCYVSLLSWYLTFLRVVKIKLLEPNIFLTDKTGRLLSCVHDIAHMIITLLSHLLLQLPVVIFHIDRRCSIHLVL